MLLFWPFQETIPKKTAVACEDTKTNKLNEGFCEKTKEAGKSLREINFLFLFHFFRTSNSKKAGKAELGVGKLRSRNRFKRLYGSKDN